MLHNEARKLLIQALERSHNVREVARNYSVNRSTVYRLTAQVGSNFVIICTNSWDCYKSKFRRIAQLHKVLFVKNTAHAAQR